MKSFYYSAIYFNITTFGYSPHEYHIQENKCLNSCQCYVLAPYIVIKISLTTCETVQSVGI